MRLRGGVVLALVTACAPSPSPRDPTPVQVPSVPPAPSTPADEAAPRVEAPVEAPSAPAPGTPEPDPAEGRKPSLAEEKECAARGGKIEPVCMSAELVCVVRYRDAGKRCTDKKDCLGECLYEGPDPPPAKPAGRCQRTSDPCGCKAPIVGGQVQPTLCAD